MTSKLSLLIPKTVLALRSADLATSPASSPPSPPELSSPRHVTSSGDEISVTSTRTSPSRPLQSLLTRAFVTVTIRMFESLLVKVSKVRFRSRGSSGKGGRVMLTSANSRPRLSSPRRDVLRIGRGLRGPLHSGALWASEPQSSRCYVSRSHYVAGGGGLRRPTVATPR